MQCGREDHGVGLQVHALWRAACERCFDWRWENYVSVAWRYVPYEWYLEVCGLDGIADVLQLVSMLRTETSKMPLLSIPSLRSPSPKRTDRSTLLASKQALKAVDGSPISRSRVVSADPRKSLLLVEVAVRWERLRL